MYSSFLCQCDSVWAVHRKVKLVANGDTAYRWKIHINNRGNVQPVLIFNKIGSVRVTYPNTISLEESAFKAIWCSRQEKKKKRRYIRLHAKCPIFLPDFNQVWSSSTHFSIEVPHIKFDRNPSSGSRIVTTCRRTYGRTDGHESKRIFSGYANAPKSFDFTHRVYLCFSHDCDQ